jgi:hypothetical protein
MGWAATTTPVDRRRQDGIVLRFLVEDNLHLYKGEIIRLNAAGFATNAVPATGDMAAGIALEEVDNTLTGHAQGGKSILVQTEGVCVTYHDDAPTIGDVGTAALCAGGAGDDAHVVVSGAFSAANACLCGAIIGPYYDPVTGIIASAAPYPLWVKLKTLQQIKTS